MFFQPTPFFRNYASLTQPNDLTTLESNTNETTTQTRKQCYQSKQKRNKNCFQSCNKHINKNNKSNQLNTDVPGAKESDKLDKYSETLYSWNF